eukprot:237797_1
MDCHALDYVHNLLKYIASVQDTPHAQYSLKKITLQSTKQTDIKESSTLSKIAKKGERNDIAYRKYQWEISYERTPDLRHTLVFTKRTKQKKDKLESMAQLLVKFDQMVRNEKVDWRGHRNDELESFAKIMKQLQRDGAEQVITSSTDVSLARLFLRNLGNLQRISIPNLKLQPTSLVTALFCDDDSHIKSTFSFIALKKMFTSATEVVLSECDVTQMCENEHAVLDYIVDANRKYLIQNTLTRIVFKSKQQKDGKECAALRSRVMQNTTIYRRYHWTIEYKIVAECCHYLIFEFDQTEKGKDEPKDVSYE